MMVKAMKQDLIRIPSHLNKFRFKSLKLSKESCPSPPPPVSTGLKVLPRIYSGVKAIETNNLFSLSPE
jgi:hypothetical protein